MKVPCPAAAAAGKYAHTVVVVSRGSDLWSAWPGKQKTAAVNSIFLP